MISNDFMPAFPDPNLDQQRENEAAHEHEKDNLITNESNLLEDEDDLFDNLFQPAKRREETKFSIRALQSSIKNHKAARYLVDFEDSAEFEGVTVCSIPKGTLDEKRKLIGAQQRAEREIEEKNHAKFLKALDFAENKSLSRVRLWHQATERYKDHFERVKRMKHRQYKRNLGNAFHAANNHFNKVIKKRKKKIKTLYGNLNEYRLSKWAGFWHNVTWRNVPQKIKLRVQFVRGVKDKLPKGYYILLVTLRDRVGGKIVTIRNRDKKKRGDFSTGFYQQTMEVYHDGKFSSLEMTFDQELYLVSPSQVKRKPYMTFTFELIQTSGPTPGLCCAWGSFPVEDSSFNIISGKFKVPLLRGWITNEVDQYWKYHKEVNRNLDKWMGNLYFQVKPMPREKRGKVEKQVHVQHLKKLSDVVLKDEDEKIISISSSDSSEDVDTQDSEEEDTINESTSEHESDTDDEFSFSDKDSNEDLDELQDSDDEKVKLNKPKTKNGEIELLDFDDDEQEDYDDKSKDLLSFDEDSDDYKENKPLLRKTSTISNRKISNKASEKNSALSRKASIDSNKIPMLRKESSLSNKIPLLRQNSNNSKLSIQQPIALQSVRTDEEIELVDDGKPIIRRNMKLSELDEYKYNLPQPTGYKESLLTFRKGKYLAKSIFNDMGISSFDSLLTREFWVTIFLLIVSFFLRQYSHYFGQYAMLWLFNVPSVQYYPNILYVDLNYQNLFLSLWQEIFVIVSGVGLNLILFTVLVLLIYFSQKAGVNVPSFASKLCVLFGVMTFLDPYLVLLSDCIFRRWDSGDWFKLYIFYEGQVSGEGFWGIFVTTLLYFYLSLITAAIMYRFILRIFMNGRIIDVFARVHGEQSSFFVPLDLEVSREELDYACLKAKKFRGVGGVFRRLVVMEYSLTDPRDDSFFERSIHIIIYSLIPKAGGVYQRKVFRQFLQLENLAIVEIFDDNDAKSLMNNQMRSIDSSNIMNRAEDLNNSDADTVSDSDEDNYISESHDNSDSDLINDESNYDSDSTGEEELLSF